MPSKSCEYGLINPLWAQKMLPSPLVYGFPLVEAPLKATANSGLFPIPPGLTGGELLEAEDQQADDMLDHLLEAASEAAQIPYDQVAYVDAVAYKTGKVRWLLAIAACRKPRMDILPQGEDMERLRALMQSYGITGEPRWYKLIYG